jgi:hypothetical protein
MPAEPDKNKRLVAWNGVYIHIPADWDTRVSGPRHLVFEKDFQPQLQIRWEKSAHRSPSTLQEKLTHYAGRMGSIITEDNFPVELQQLKDTFDLLRCYRGESGMFEGGVFFCSERHTLVLFQLPFPDSPLLKEVGDCLATLSSHTHAETLWRIQDFSLTIPVSYLLKDYTFGAGLTRLSFCSSDLFLQTCKLGPADSRLDRQSLEEILITLTDAPGLKIITGRDGNSCEGHRNPTILNQVLFRLRREKPFIWARIWHDAASNRLLAVVFSSNRPIPPTTPHKIYGQYEIIQKENSIQGNS